MIALYDVASGAKVGRITEKQLEALMGWMEEESTEDRDYYLTAEDCESDGRAGHRSDLDRQRCARP